jgi:YD repeat-containing protein
MSGGRAMPFRKVLHARDISVLGLATHFGDGKCLAKRTKRVLLPAGQQRSLMILTKYNFFYMKRRSLSFLVAFVFVTRLNGHAQDGPVNILSPEAAGFAKSGNIPVSTYTGVPGINVPLFTVHDGDISLPISLSYNASGIKVQEDATWVGLGFNLNAGGQITRAVRGQDDFMNDGSSFNYESGAAMAIKPLFNQGEGGVTQQVIRRTIPMIFPPDLPPFNIQTKSGLVNFFDVNFNPYAYDWIPDMFSFSAGNNSGRFVLDDNGVPMTLKKSNTKIALVNGLDFQVTGEDGLIYTYSLRDDNASMMITAPHVANVWYLTKIQSANGNNVVNFVYGTGSLQTNTITTQKATLQTDGNIATSSFSNYTIDSYAYLTEIDFKGGKVVFQSSGNRTDVIGARQLDAAILYDAAGQQVTKYSFQYSYFHSNDGTNPLITDRLKLDAVVLNDDIHQAYTFNYNMDNVPAKNAGQDHWGYYNNAGLGIPNFIYSHPVTLSDRTIINEYASSDGTDYEAHWPYTQAMMLNQVTYPTGGYSKFTYEPNEFGNIPDYWKFSLSTDPPQVEMIYPVESVDNGSIQVTNALTRATDYNLHCSFNCDPTELNDFYIELDAEDGTFLDRYTLADFNVDPSHYFVLDVPNLGLSGRVICKVWSSRNNNFPLDKDFFLFFNLNLTQNMSTSYLVNNNFTRVSGGGLRVRKIVNGDGTTENSYREYKYDNPDGSTSGTIMNFPAYLSFPTFEVAYSNVYAYFSSTSVIGLSTSAGGSFIGYGHVTEYTGDSVNNTGSTESDYINVPDLNPWVYGADLPCLQTSENGLLLKQVQFDVGHNTISELNYNYNNFDLNWNSTTGVNVFHPDVIWQANGSGTDGTVPPAIYFWRDYQLDYKPLNKTSKLYSANHQDFAQTTTQYQYGTNSNPRKVIESTSTGLQNQTEYRYADDFTVGSEPTFVSEMVSYNILGKPIEMVKSKVNGSVNQAVAGVLNEYGTGVSRGLIKNKYNLDIASPLSWGDANFSSALSNSAFAFNSNYTLKNSFNFLNGNVIDYQNTQQNSSYLWAYNDQYPVVKCINATSSEFYAENFEENTSASVITGAAHTGTKFYNGAFTVNWSIPNSRNYVISYWYRISGVWKLAAPQPYVGPSMVLVGGDAYDDIRIYPRDALMTTYTYQRLVGMTAECDINNRVTYYEYDGFGRLKDVRDQNGNIIRTNEYHYKGE